MCDVLRERERDVEGGVCLPGFILLIGLEKKIGVWKRKQGWEMTLRRTDSFKTRWLCPKEGPMRPTIQDCQRRQNMNISVTSRQHPMWCIPFHKILPPSCEPLIHAINMCIYVSTHVEVLPLKSTHSIHGQKKKTELVFYYLLRVLLFICFVYFLLSVKSIN